MAEMKNLITKLAEVMAEVGPVNKRGQNEAQHYSYVKATDLANAIRKKLSAKGVFMTSDVVEVRHTEFTTAKGAFMRSVDMKVLYTFHDGTSGEKISFHGYGSGMDSGDKAVYKAHTGALKYALRNAFLVPDEKGDPEFDREDRETVARNAGSSKPETVNGLLEKTYEKDGKLYLTLGGKLCYSTVPENQEKLRMLEGKDVELVVLDLKQKVNGKAAYSIHMVTEVPEQVVA